MEPSTSLLTFVILSLASYRITHFIVLDELLGSYPDEENPRGTGVRKLADLCFYTDEGNDRGPIRGWFAKLVTCVWCTGVWVSFAVVLSWMRLAPWNMNVDGWLLFIGIAGAQGFLASRLNA